MDELARVAVLGVPRGGTSLVVGLLRLAGCTLPTRAPDCTSGEDAQLRGPRVRESMLSRLAPGTVWKDPSVGLYVHRLRLEGWRLVVVHREPWAVATSEHERTGQAWRGAYDRARQWQGAIDHWIGDRAHVRLSYAGAVADPLGAYVQLAELVGGSADREAEVRAFVQRDGGYRCPDPAGCELDHEEAPTTTGPREQSARRA